MSVCTLPPLPLSTVAMLGAIGHWKYMAIGMYVYCAKSSRLNGGVKYVRVTLLIGLPV
jgi:hypothetical protein